MASSPRSPRVLAPSLHHLDRVGGASVAARRRRSRSRARWRGAGVGRGATRELARAGAAMVSRSSQRSRSGSSSTSSASAVARAMHCRRWSARGSARSGCSSRLPACAGPPSAFTCVAAGCRRGRHRGRLGECVVCLRFASWVAVARLGAGIALSRDDRAARARPPRRAPNARPEDRCRRRARGRRGDLGGQRGGSSCTDQRFPSGSAKNVNEPQGNSSTSVASMPRARRSAHTAFASSTTS